MNRALIIIGYIILVGLVSVGGMVGAALMFADYSQGESEMDRVWTIFFYHLLAPLVAGVIVPRHWYIGIMVGWGAAVFTFFILLGRGDSGMDIIPPIALILTVIGSRAGAELGKLIRKK